MRRARPLARRSATDWSFRVLLAALIALTGGLAIARTLGSTIRTSDPARAHGLSLKDGRITAVYAASLAGAEATAQQRRVADRWARDALRQDPTAVIAASTLGLNAQVRGDVATARRFFTYSETLSRRDLQTQLWAVENAVAGGNIAQALRHYDVALRTSRIAADLMFPVMASAISDATISDALARTLATRPPWAENFIDHAASNAPDSRAAVRLLARLRQLDMPVSQEVQAGVIGRLLDQEHVADAWSFYASIRPRATRIASRDPRFTADVSAPSRFDWMAINDGGVSAVLQQGNGGGVLDFSVGPGAAGVVLQQVQVLPPGRYRLRGHSVGIAQAPGAQPYWQLICRDGRELGRIPVPNSDVAGGMFGGDVQVTNACPVQTLALIARPSDAMAGVTGQIDRVQLALAQ